MYRNEYVRYGVISDVHGSIENYKLLVDRLKNEDIDYLILNGDIGDDEKTIYEVLEHAGKSDLETIYSPGNHEPIEGFMNASIAASGKYKNLYSALDKQKYSIDGHDVVILPGTGYNGGGFVLGIFDFCKSGFYESFSGRRIWRTNLNELGSLIDNPEKTILFSHVPRRFNKFKEGIDSIRVGVVKVGFRSRWGGFSTGQIIPHSKAKFLKNQGYDLDIVYRNNGDLKLKEKLEEIESTNPGFSSIKTICGHFHSAVGRAVDYDGRTVGENNFVYSLHWNASSSDDLCCGIIDVECGDRVRYKNIRL